MKPLIFSKGNQFKCILIHSATFLSIFLLVTMSGCEKTESFRNETRVEGKMSFLDVISARALMLGGKAGTLKSDGSLQVGPGSSLFKITEEGIIQEIKYWQIDTIYIETEDGIEIEIDSTELTNVIYPVHIFDASDDYLIICFDEEKEGDTHHPYEYEFLIRKSDGAVFELPPGRRPLTRWTHYNQMFRNEEASVVIQHDPSDNIYYLGGGDIQKLSTQNPDNLTLHQLTTGGHTGEGVMNYRVNGDGHIIFKSGGISTASSTRIRNSNGQLQYPEKDIIPFWRGFDNSFYYSFKPEYSPGGDNYPVIEKLSVNNGNVSYDRIGAVVHADAEHTALVNSFIFKVKNANKIVVLGFGTDMWQGGIMGAEVYNSEGVIKAFTIDDLGITSINMGISSDNYYYVSGLDGNQPVLLKIDPSGFPHQVESLLPRGSHDLYKMVVTADDYVFFHALRMSDGNIIIGEISPGGTVTELEDIGTDVLQLVRIQ
jgi:hypothetical protein